MGTVRLMKLNVRTWLGDPLSQRPSDKQVYLTLFTQIQSFFNRAALSSHPWAVGELYLTVAPSQEDYPLPTDSSFGKPIQVRTVYPANPSHIERDVDFYEIEDINFDWPYPKDYGSLIFNPDGSPHTAQRMGFFRKGGNDQVYVRVIPIPAQPATYQVLYQIGDWVDYAAVDDAPMLPEHHSLIEIRSALSLLPLTWWSEDKVDNAARRRELSIALAAQESRLASEFNDYIKSTTVGRRLSYRKVMSID